MHIFCDYLNGVLITSILQDIFLLKSQLPFVATGTANLAISPPHNYKDVLTVEI